MGLTEREVQVLRLLARGLSTKAIAEQLVISPKTAGSHIENFTRKLAPPIARRRVFPNKERPPIVGLN
jgi:DNA-binding NarL/FixJ family response regulator